MKGFCFRYLLTVCLLVVFSGSMLAQSIIKNGVSYEYAVTTAVPFLRIAPDARMSGMGDAGIALQPDSISDASACYLNPAKLAYNTKPLGISISYTPWLKQLVNDIYLADISGYYKINKLQAVSMSLRYFSLGQIQFTNQNGESTGQFRPNEFALDAHYSRILAKGFSAAIGLRFIYSNLATGQSVNNVPINAGKAGAADIAFYYNHPINVGGLKSNIAFGLNLSNLGSKISYTSSVEKDYIPMNMGWGASWQLNLDKHNMINVVVDANKLLVPTPNTIIDTATGIYAYKEKSVPEAIISSFYDAPLKTEWDEVNWSFGLEYWYDKLFAVRAGYFYEAPGVGDRQFFTAGVGLRYSVFGLDFSYLIPSSNIRNPLDNTLQFTLVFNFKQLGKDKSKTPSTEPVDNVKTSMLKSYNTNSAFPF